MPVILVCDDCHEDRPEVEKHNDVILCRDCAIIRLKIASGEPVFRKIEEQSFSWEGPDDTGPYISWGEHEERCAWESPESVFFLGEHLTLAQAQGLIEELEAGIDVGPLNLPGKWSATFHIMWGPSEVPDHVVEEAVWEWLAVALGRNGEEAND